MPPNLKTVAAALRCMTPGEMLFRAGLSLRKRFNKLLDRPDACGPQLRTRVLFPAADHPRTRDLLRNLPTHSLLLEQADSIRNGSVALYETVTVPIGSSDDWRRGFPSGSLFPQVNFAHCPLSLPDADVRITWELNRHQCLLTLARAHAATDNVAYADAAVELLNSWIKTNPYPVGVNWTSALEVALRAISWTFLHHLLRACASFVSLEQRFLQTLYRHGNYLDRYATTGFNLNNHVIGESAGLFILGLFLDAGPRTDRWKRKGLALLEKHLRLQVFPSGASREQSAAYHRFVLDLFTVAFVAGSNAGVSFSNEFRVRLHRMHLFLSELASPDGRLMSVGDSDDGRGFHLTTCSRLDVRPSLSTGAAIFEDVRLAGRAGAFDEESYWLTGPAGLDRFAALAPVPPSLPDSRRWEDADWIWFRSSRPQSELFFDAGPQGIGRVAPHGHADTLCVALSVAKEPVLIDPGTWAYNLDRPLRDFFRSTFAHNTVTVDGLPHTEPRFSFRWSHTVDARLEQFHLGARFQYAAASHDAYRNLPDPVTHQREVLALPGLLYIIGDSCSALAEHVFTWTWHFAGNVQLTPEPGAWDAKLASGNGCRLFFPFEGDSEILTGRSDPPQGWASDSYAERYPAPVLSLSHHQSGPFRAFTLLVPYAADQGPGGCVPAPQKPLSFTFTQDGHRTYLQLLVPGLTIDPTISTDADWGVLRRESDGSATGFFVNVSRVALGPRVLVELSERRPFVEVDCT